MPPLPASSEPSLPPHHSRMSADDRRRQLIEVAIDLFSRRGFAGTTTREIAAAAGVTEAIIFRHFATKQDLYKAILDYRCHSKEAGDWLTETEKFMDADDDEGLFRLLISTLIRTCREDPQFKRLLMHAALEGHELAIMHHNQMALPIGAKFREYILRRQQQGALLNCDPGAVLFALAGIPQFYALQKYIYKHGEIALTDEEVTETFVRILMGGLSRGGLRTKEPNGNQ